MSTAVQAGEVDPDLQSQLQSMSPMQPVQVIVTLDSRPNLNAIKDKDKLLRRSKLVKSMRAHAKLKQKSLMKFLNKKATDVRELWLINAVSARLPAKYIQELAKLPGVANVKLDATLGIPGPGGNSNAPAEWNLNAVHAPDLWNLNLTGQGVVVANMDSGVDVAHPDLGSRWRGGSNSWYDPHGQHSTPIDISGHGTQTMGIMVGGDAGGSFVGVAPGVKWIAVKVFNDAGNALESHFHLGFQWLLDPDGIDLTDDAPDVINASFQTSGGGVCDTHFNTDLQNLKTAGIAVVLAAGNSGPNPSTSSSPANNPAGYAAGAVDIDNVIDSYSARGPSSCDGSLFPELVAPGVNVYTTDLSFGGIATYMFATGTSFSAPHIAGGMALLLGAYPNASVSELENTLIDTATDLGVAGPDNTYGHGLVNLLAAYNALGSNIQNPLAAPDTYSLNEDGSLSTPVPGVLGNDSDPQNAPLTSILVSSVSYGSLTLNSDGSFIYIPTADFNGVDSFTYKASDGSNDSSAATVTLNVNPVSDPSVVMDDNFVGSEDSVITGNVTNNDTNPDQLIAILVSGPSHGELNLNANGSFSYSPAGNYHGFDSFTYKLNNGEVDSAIAVVSLDIQAVNDASVVNAGADQTIMLPSDASLVATATDSDSSLTTTWSKVSGPGLVTFGNVNALSTTASFSLSGKYVLRLAANDGQFMSFDDVQVTVKAFKPTIYFSTRGNANPTGLTGSADNSDIYLWNGLEFSRVVDASAITNPVPKGANIDGLKLVDPSHFYASFAGNVKLPGLGTVQDEDIVYYNAGTWSVFFDGTPGLGVSSKQDIDAYSISESTVYFSTLGNSNPNGLTGKADDADIYAWNGAEFSRVIDVTAIPNPVPERANVDGLKFVDITHFYLSFASDVTLPGLGKVQDEDIVYYNAGIWSVYFDGTPVLGASASKEIDGFDLQ